MSTDSIPRPTAARQGPDDASNRRSAADGPALGGPMLDGPVSGLNVDGSIPDGPTSAGPTPDDVQPVAFENLDRFLTGLITVGPMIALGVVAWQLWDGLLHGSDLIVFAFMLRNSSEAIDYLHLPRDNVVEMGRQFAI